ncbi:hypothetical protein FACS1894109_17330 [Spirochaetia bacterium]|nr:hypothetical protein FACS1894109_17330 [Spirochaetia bacterium]
MSKYLKKMITIILFGISAAVYSQEIFNSNDYYLMGDIGVSYDGTEFHLDLMGSYGFYFDTFGSLYLRPELELYYKNDSEYYSWRFGPHLSALYGYNIGAEAFSVFLYGGAGIGYNFLLSSTESSGSSGWVGNGIFGAKLLFYGFGAYAEYRMSFLGGTNRLSVGLTFAVGGSSYAPTPYKPPAPAPAPPPPAANNKNRDRDYF